MVFPLAFYVFGFLWSLPEFREQQFYLFLFEPRLMFGRVVALVGFIIFLTALVQMLKAGRKGLLTGGLYSVVRHPQYFGIMVVTLGLTIMAIQWSGLKPNVVLVWFIGVLGYVLLAGYEERYLSSRFEKEYQQYKQKVPFIFPVSISRIPEPILTLIITLTITFMLTLI
ncbi:isoprenylcysteine carboxylmethyltransferase family protein [Candidatus Bathyarchaeota archaeon]|nr:isoprenylcysteine carboxylmethyltransferase family protein [Candidatus Bathyarchaeota archaeon]